LLEGTVQRARRDFHTRLASDRDCARLARVMILAMNALLADKIPPVRLKARDQFLNLRWHRIRIVLVVPRSGVGSYVLLVGATFALPEGAPKVWAQMLGPFTGDRELIEALV